MRNLCPHLESPVWGERSVQAADAGKGSQPLPQATTPPHSTPRLEKTSRDDQRAARPRWSIAQSPTQSSVVCFKGVITGMEDALGEKATAIALIAAGRARGKRLVNELGLANLDISLDEMAKKLDHALGEDGTRLCMSIKLNKMAS